MNRCAVVGAGLIGRAWAIAFARGGFSVALYDAAPGVLPDARVWIEAALADLESYDLLQGQAPRRISERIVVEPDLAHAVAGATLVQENVPEKLESKRAVFAELDGLCDSETVLASSTSGFLPSALSAGLAGQERCLVAHPLNPPYLVPAVELVPAPWTAPEAMDRAAECYSAIGMTPVRMRREIEGFIMNRLQGALKHEAWRLVAGGYCSAEDVDRGVAEGLGLRWSFMGPFETAELNAPGGIRDYVERYGELYAGIGRSQSEIVPWEGDVLDQVEAARRAVGPVSDLAGRRDWRDRRLMALAAHKRESDGRWGK